MKPNYLKDKVQKLLNNQKTVYIELKGKELLLAEGYCRIEDYNENTVVLSSEKLRISVTGEYLKLSHLSNERMAIEGSIKAFEFI